MTLYTGLYTGLNTGLKTSSLTKYASGYSGRFPSNATEFGEAFPGITVPDSMWKFDDASGNITDLIGSANLTPSAAQFTYEVADSDYSGEVGVKLNTQGAYSLSAGNVYNPGTDKLTIFMRAFIPDAGATRYLAEKVDSTGSADGWHLRTSGAGHIFLQAYDGGAGPTPQILSLTQDIWYDIMFTFDMSGATLDSDLYIYNTTDGKQSDSRSGVGTEMTTTEDMVFGSLNSGGNAEEDTIWAWAAVWDGVVLTEANFDTIRGA